MITNEVLHYNLGILSLADKITRLYGFSYPRVLGYQKR